MTQRREQTEQLSSEQLLHELAKQDEAEANFVRHIACVIHFIGCDVVVGDTHGTLEYRSGSRWGAAKLAPRIGKGR